MNKHDQAGNGLQQSYTPPLLSRAVIADTGFELSVEPPTGPARKLRLRPHTENQSWWLIEHTQTTGGWHVAGVEPLANAEFTAFATSNGSTNK